MVFQGT